MFFGQLTDVTGTATLAMENVVDTNLLIQQLNLAYPGLNTKKYIVAVNAKVVGENTTLTNNCTVALLPPFSGG